LSIIYRSCCYGWRLVCKLCEEVTSSQSANLEVSCELSLSLSLSLARHLECMHQPYKAFGDRYEILIH
jgi:hypothetical protein